MLSITRPDPIYWFILALTLASRLVILPVMNRQHDTIDLDVVHQHDLPRARVRGCQWKRLDGERVRYSLCIRRTAYGLCTEYIRVVRSTLTQYNMETSPPTIWLVLE